MRVRINEVKIKCLLIERDFKYDDLIKELNIDLRTLHNRFEKSNWKFEEIYILSEYLKVNMYDLIKREDD